MLCVFVHGWGMNRAIWQQVIETMQADIECVAVDLPGHGLAATESFSSLKELSGALSRYIDRPAVWVGWSLGGLAVMQLALDQPRLVQGMLLVATTPCFTQREDWPYGMTHEVFDGFETNLQSDYMGTIKRFLSLQVKDSATGRGILKQLRENVLQQPAANPHALSAGLEVLKSADLRKQMSCLDMPTAFALGARDGLVDVDTSEYVKQVLPSADIQIYNDASHAPFLSNLPEFSVQLNNLFKKVHGTHS